MYLKRLEIHGFKSFAHKTTLEFSQGVIAIVGPNGSGKSNVADCLRWVLGEQSPKLMRGKKSEDVIFAGSDKKGRVGFAEVVATFDNADRRIPVDSAEVSIGRRVDRSGESEYLINGNKVRLLDIVDLVLKSNIGTSRYTVIGQGTIDQMILAGPSEIKSLLDEASGVKTYYIKREKTLRRLEQTAQNLMRAEDLIAEIEPRLKSLRRQAKKMEARSEIETELKVFQREYFGKTYWTLKKTIDSYQAQLGHLQQKRQGLQQQLEGSRQQLDLYENNLQSGNAEFRKLQLNLERMQGHKNRILEDLSLVRGKMQSQKTGNAFDAQTLTVEIHDKERKISELKEKASQTKQERETHESQFVAQTRVLDQVAKQLDQLYHTINNPLEVDWQVVEKQLNGMEGTLDRFFAGLDSLPLEEVRRQAGEVRQSFISFKEVIQVSVLDPRASLNQARAELEKVLKQKEALSDEINSLQLNISKARFSEDFLSKQVVQLEQEKLHLDLELKRAQSGSHDDFWQQLTVEEKRIEAEMEKIGQEIAQAETQLKAYYDQDEAKKKQLREIENAFRELQDQLSKLKDQESALSIEKAKFDTQMEAVTKEIHRILGPEIYGNIQAQEVASHTEGLEEKIAKLKNQLDMIGGMDELTLKEYQETEARHANLSSQVNDLKQGMTDLRNIIEELDEHIKSKFNEAFHRINEKFEFYFRMLFNGGRAYLSILRQEEPKGEEGQEDNDESFAEATGDLRPEEKIVQKYEKGASNIVGIDMKATPPGKKLANIQALSGGERSLTSIALLCSLLTCFPSPFVVLDEVDAALDDANTIRFGQILGRLANQTQFLTITHNRETMAQANILYGVTMGDDGISKLLSVKLDQAKQYAK